MSYIQKNLNPGEKLNHFTKPSTKPIIVFSVGYFIFCLFMAHIIFEMQLLYAIPTSVLIIAFYISIEIIKRYVSEFAISNKRVISKLGLIRRDVEEMNLNSIESVNIKQGIVGRILNYGNIVISGRGASKVEFTDIDDPVVIRKKIKHKD